MNTKFITVGRATAAIINGTAHILKRSSSSYGLLINGMRLQYCCQDSCCDSGLRPDVESLVQQAKELGATKVVIRTGQRQYNYKNIVGLPVEDVSNHVGKVDEDIFINRVTY